MSPWSLGIIPEHTPQAPQPYTGVKKRCKAPTLSDYDASAPTLYELIKARTDIPVSSLYILVESTIFFNNKIANKWQVVIFLLSSYRHSGTVNFNFMGDSRPASICIKHSGPRPAPG